MLLTQQSVAGQWLYELSLLLGQEGMKNNTNTWNTKQNISLQEDNNTYTDSSAQDCVDSSPLAYFKNPLYGNTECGVASCLR